MKITVITISNNLSKIKPFSDCVLQIFKISSTLSKVIIWLINSLILTVNLLTYVFIII